MRFVENHDEPRAAATFEPGRARAAAVVMSTLRGARLYHDGQLDGLRTRPGVFLARGPAEPVDAELRAFYERLLGAVADSGLRDGDWRLCDCAGWPDNASFEQLLAWCWRADERRRLVIVNLAAGAAQARVRLPWDDLAGRSWRLRDALGGATFDRDGGELQFEGLYVAMAPWESYLFELESIVVAHAPVRLGALAGEIEIGDDFDDPLPELAPSTK